MSTEIMAKPEHHITPDDYVSDEEVKEVFGKHSESDEKDKIHLSPRSKPEHHIEKQETHDVVDIDKDVEMPEEGQQKSDDNEQKISLEDRQEDLKMEDEHHETEEASLEVPEEGKAEHTPEKSSSIENKPFPSQQETAEFKINEDEHVECQPKESESSKMPVHPTNEQVDPQPDETPEEDPQNDDDNEEMMEEEKESEDMEITATKPQKTAEEIEQENAAKEEIKQQQLEKLQNMIQTAQTLKQEGNVFFKDGDYKKAKAKYTRVFAYTRAFISSEPDGGEGMVNMAMKASGLGEITDEFKLIAKNLERDVNNNMAIIFLKEENWTKVVEKSTKSLKIEKNVKGYFNRGKAYAMKNDFESAYKDFEEGKKDFPDEAKIFDSEIQKTKTREKAYDKKTNEKYAGFLSK